MRLKVFYFLVLFGALVIGSTLLMVKLTFQEQFQMLKDVSLGAMSIFSWLLAVLATAMLLPKDMEDRTLYTILAKPVPRFEYLLGKLLGVLALLLVAVLLMTSVFVVVLYYQQQVVLAQTALTTAPRRLGQAALQGVRDSTFNLNLVAGIISIYLKAALCASLTLFLSTLASSWIFTIMMSVMVYFIGHLQGLARQHWVEDQGGTWLTTSFLGIVSLFFPDLQLFSLVDDIAAGTAVPALLFWKMAGLGVTYTVIYLLAAYYVFSAKEL